MSVGEVIFRKTVREGKRERLGKKGKEGGRDRGRQRRHRARPL